MKHPLMITKNSFFNDKNQFLSLNSPKLIKLKNLLQNSNNSQRKILLNEKVENSRYLSTDLSKDFPLYLSLVEKPINLLFSMDQFVFEFSRKNYQQKKAGEFFQQLKERKKLSLFYGHLTRKHLSNLFDKVKNNKGYFYKNVFSLLERRLDVVVYRTGITQTIAEARQLITHKKIRVNQNLVNIPSYLLNPGDVISILPKTASRLKSEFCKNGKPEFSRKHSKILGDFYSRLKRLLDTSSKMSRKSQKTEHHFQSKKVCNFLIQFLCTRIKLRCFWDVKKTQFKNIFCLQQNGVLNLKNGGNLELDLLNKKNLESQTKKNSLPSVLTLFKRKSFSSLAVKSKKIKTSVFTNSSQFQRNLQETLYANKGSLQKNPIFWSRNLVNLKQKTSFDKNKFLSPVFKNSLNGGTENQDFKQVNFSKGSPLSFFEKKRTENGEYPFVADKGFSLKRKNLAIYRESLLILLKILDNSRRFKGLVTLNMKKSLFKRSQFKSKSTFWKILTFRAVKPLHLEVSYNLLQVIYLYSPQRVNFPFSIDLDLIKRSLR